MNGSQFDRMSRVFAQRRVSRRQILAQGGAGVAAGTLAASLLTNASAQDATPAADDVQDPSFLFLQSFQSGSIAPKTGEDGTYTLTLEHGLGQTIFFSDRPERIVGASPTAAFLKGLGFSPSNPPNAALLLEAAPGDTDIAVVELMSPGYDESTHTATYDVRILEEYERTLEMSFAAQPSDLAQLHPSFGAAHLFIDDCANGNITCTTNDLNYPCPGDGICGSFPTQGYCYSWSAASCLPCEPYHHLDPTVEMVAEWWTKQCNSTFQACQDVPEQAGCYVNFNS